MKIEYPASPGRSTDPEQQRVDPGGACARCGVAYGPSSLVEFLGQPHCGRCRDEALAALQDSRDPVLDRMSLLSAPLLLGSLLMLPVGLLADRLGLMSMIPANWRSPVGTAIGGIALLAWVMGMSLHIAEWMVRRLQRRNAG